LVTGFACLNARAQFDQQEADFKPPRTDDRLQLGNLGVALAPFMLNQVAKLLDRPDDIDLRLAHGSVL
jgi:hypothetical protein